LYGAGRASNPAIGQPEQTEAHWEIDQDKAAGHVKATDKGYTQNPGVCPASMTACQRHRRMHPKLGVFEDEGCLLKPVERIHQDSGVF